jgi:hypothetical protein
LVNNFYFELRGNNRRTHHSLMLSYSIYSKKLGLFRILHPYSAVNPQHRTVYTGQENSLS